MRVANNPVQLKPRLGGLVDRCGRPVEPEPGEERPALVGEAVVVSAGAGLVAFDGDEPGVLEVIEVLIGTGFADALVENGFEAAPDVRPGDTLLLALPIEAWR